MVAGISNMTPYRTQSIFLDVCFQQLDFLNIEKKLPIISKEFFIAWVDG
jgi:hypothetical protein